MNLNISYDRVAEVHVGKSEGSHLSYQLFGVTYTHASASLDTDNVTL